MKPLESLPHEVACRVHGILFDLDDTFLSHGVLEKDAFDALFGLREAGLGLICVTGRPSGWGEVIVRQWPIDAAVTENGAVTLVRAGRGLRIVEECSPEERRARRARLDELVRLVKKEIPQAELSDDAHMRRSDVTWDIGERMRLPKETVAAIAKLVKSHGARATASSVHLHATYDSADKASGAIRALRMVRGEDEGSATTRWAFIGDSGNDRACFAAFAATFGVANVKEHIESLSVPPRWVARAPMGRGFAEISRAILAGRQKQ
jgi:hydroxymethylpyrimidine pyrophosphatase-like HAD family hydrolase